MAVAHGLTSRNRTLMCFWPIKKNMASEMPVDVLPVVSFIIFNQIEDDDDHDETLSFSSSEEDSDDEENEMHILYAILMIHETRGETPQIEKITDYVERVVSGYSRITFKEHFRMFPETFEMILMLLRPAINATNVRGRKQISAKKQLMITLWFMGTPDSYRSVCVKFGVGKATALRAVRRVTYALHCLAPRFIKWPRGEEVTRVIEKFKAAKNFPGVIGAIDGSFIQIRAPKQDAASYICRKNYHAIHLQVVCDARSVFTHCYAGHVGSMHDARVFRNSPIAEFIQRPNEYFPSDSHLVGDAAYTINTHVMVPYRDNGHLTAKQKNYNHCLSSTQMAIARAIWLLKVRFRILLDCLPLTDITKIPQFIVACCVMHNICILQNDNIDNLVVCPHDRNNASDVIPVGADLGKQKRIRITNELRMRLGNDNN